MPPVQKKKEKKAYCKEMTFPQYSDLIDFERNTFENKVKSTKINNLFKGEKKDQDSNSETIKLQQNYEIIVSIK